MSSRKRRGAAGQSAGYAPFSQQGGLGRTAQLFGDRLHPLLEKLNEILVA